MLLMPPPAPLRPSTGRHYAQVAVNRPFDQPLSYAIPAELQADLRVGSLVEAPLRTRKARGVVVDITDHIAFRGPIKPVARLLTPDYHVAPELMELARWLAEYYWSSPGEALAAVSFIGLNDVHSKMRTHLALAQPDHWLAVSREVGPDGRKVTKKQAQVIHSLLASGNEPEGHAELCAEAGVGQGVLATMLKHGWLERVQEPEVREDQYPLGDPLPAVTNLTAAQSAAIERINKQLHGHTHQTFLLHGVTGSGKTEVYLRAVAEGLRIGRGAIVLVPEIALTPQTVARFRERFGAQVGVYHSRLSLGQKYDLWRKIESAQVRVVIGARSAVFSPIPTLGIIIADEEHETTYKQDDAPRYHARDVAVWRASRAGAVALLGTATPSMESMHNCATGKYERLILPDRIGPHAPPLMTIIDMKRHLIDGAASQAGSTEATIRREAGRSLKAAALLSPRLSQAIEDRLRRKEQTVLLLNRRGFANHVLCFRCEKPLACPHCDATLTWHKRIGRLICHWCGHAEPMPKACPKCEAPEIYALGLGTQKVEELLGEAFPGARVIRIDVDSMKGRRSFIEVWERISRGEVDIILGTQMIAKGLHLENVTLVGVVSADFALFMPDFRCAERTFQLLTQVAGRAGRGETPGEVIVQSFIPHHYAIEHASRLDEAGFYERELRIRKNLRFPPIYRLIGVLVSGKKLEVVRDQGTRLGNMMKSLARRPGFDNVSVLGPAPAPISRLDDRHRWRILLRGPSPREIHELLRDALAAFDRVHEKGKISLAIDVDPVDLM
jgi:primosomal protein N' (replication factor Y)